jgi:uncharacterized protein YdhG (YjbR/CyaY superfamily)
MVKDTDEYISKFPEDTQKILNKIRKTIQTTAPKAEEAMQYGVPAFKLNGKYIACYAAFKAHAGLYPTPETIEHFKKELSEYDQSKGAIRFPLDKEIPYDLIKKIVKYNAENN